MIQSQGKFDVVAILLLIGTILVLSGGQVLFKLAANGLNLGQPKTFLSLPLVLALAVYGVATLMWLLVLARLPLSIAFPFYGLTFLLVPVWAAIFLGETLRVHTLLGGFVILVGVFICARGT